LGRFASYGDRRYDDAALALLRSALIEESDVLWGGGGGGAAADDETGDGGGAGAAEAVPNASSTAARKSFRHSSDSCGEGTIVFSADGAARAPDAEEEELETTLEAWGHDERGGIAERTESSDAVDMPPRLLPWRPSRRCESSPMPL
jgi:hypothetical protein